jgi:hypothetical protein
VSGSLTTVETIIRRVQRDFGDEAETQIRLDDIFDWINYGQLEIVRQTECLESEIVYTLTADGSSGGTSGKVEITGGIPRLILPSDFLEAQKVVMGYENPNKDYIATSELFRVQFEDVAFNQLTSTGQTPEKYFIRGGRLNFVGSPTRTSQSVTLYYVKAPAEVHNTTDQVDIPANFTQDLVEYCLMKAKELTEDYQHANMIGGRLSNRLAMSRNEANVPHDSYAVIRDDPNDAW